MTNVERHGNKIRVYFMLEGERIREPLDLPPTPENMAYATQLIAVIKTEIKTGRYDHARHFPNSKRLKENQLKHWIELYLFDKEQTLSPISYKTYQRRIRKYITPHLAHISAREITHEKLLKWKHRHLNNVSNRTQREVITNLKGILKLAEINNQIPKNPAEYLAVGDAEQPEPDPYTLDEIERIANTQSHRPEGVALGLFLIWTGARISEGIAAGWEDIDLKNGTWTINQARVDSIYKVPKTKKSQRVVELMPQAIQILKKQLHTKQNKVRKIKILQRDNRNYKEKNHYPVFINTNTNNPWSHATPYRDGFWVTHLKKAEVRYRGAKQARHTWISLMITYNLPLPWIVAQVGHTDTTMILRHYGKLLQKRDKSRYADEAARRIQNDRKST